MTPQQALARCPLFALVDSASLDAWVTAGTPITLDAGEILAKAGTPGLWMYVVLQGQVRVLRPGLFREISLGTYGPGEVLGDYALLPPNKNVSTCRMATAGRVLQLPLQHGQQILSAMPGVSGILRRWLQLSTLTAYLRDQNFLGFMSAPSALEFREKVREVAVPQGSSLQADGLANDRWFFILEGEVEVQDWGRRSKIAGRVLTAGDCFGEEALLGEIPVPHAMARSATRCLYLPAADFCEPQEACGQSITTVPADEDFPWVGQESAEDCGLAALAMVSGFHGRPLAVEKLRRKACLDRCGASLAELARLAAMLGFTAQPVQICDRQYDQLRLPAVVHFRNGHYVVLYKYAADGVSVADPAAGIVRLERTLFHKQASGFVLLLQRSSQARTGTQRTH